jgi:hypothetical protein
LGARPRDGGFQKDRGHGVTRRFMHRITGGAASEGLASFGSFGWPGVGDTLATDG